MNFITYLRTVRWSGNKYVAWTISSSILSCAVCNLCFTVLFPAMQTFWGTGLPGNLPKHDVRGPKGVHQLGFYKWRVKCYPTNRLLSRDYWILYFFLSFVQWIVIANLANRPRSQIGAQGTHTIIFLCGTFEVGCLVVGLRTKQTTTASVKCLSHSQLFNRWFCTLIN